MITKILTGLAARIALNGAVKFGGAAAKQKLTLRVVSFKSTLPELTTAKKTKRIMKLI